MTPTDDLVPVLKKLRLSGVLQTLDMRLRQAVDDDVPHSEFLLRLLTDEVERRDATQLDTRLRKASFEHRKSLEDFVSSQSGSRLELDEALYFLDVLKTEKMPFGGFVVNRTATAPVHPLLASDLPEVPPDGLSPDAWSACRGALLEAHAARSEQAAVHADAVRILREAGPRGAPCWLVPEQAEDLHDLHGLVGLGPHLPADVWSQS